MVTEKKGLSLKYEGKPGRASTEVEHSLRKFFVPGDCGSILAVGDFFSDVIFRILYFSTNVWLNLQHIGQAAITQPRWEKAVATSLCMKKERTYKLAL